ncbi:nucleotide pyrophosphohydrolase [Archaeoglobus neptunius]|uniref:nucleotide pyrophosphohydrolase n=1 Tax=Archaeoglobus neptunius TaxID=2798580 RepID=UPI001926E06E|nr:nucleotide pyrophosphohydrolase [Archaeoglobus neptunius]
MSLEELFNILRKFRDERGWKKYHTPKNLASSIVIEASELLELFQWTRSFDEEQRVLRERYEEVEDEVADILIYLLFFCDIADIDPVEAFKKKMARNEERFQR